MQCSSGEVDYPRRTAHSLGQPFLKGCGFQRQGLGRSPQRAKLSIVQEHFFFGSFYFAIEKRKNTEFVMSLKFS